MKTLILTAESTTSEISTFVTNAFQAYKKNSADPIRYIKKGDVQLMLVAQWGGGFVLMCSEPISFKSCDELINFLANIGVFNN